jgi:hypothetical protein
MTRRSPYLRRTPWRSSARCARSERELGLDNELPRQHRRGTSAVSGQITTNNDGCAHTTPSKKYLDHTPRCSPRKQYNLVLLRRWHHHLVHLSGKSACANTSPRSSHQNG